MEPTNRGTTSSDNAPQEQAQHEYLNELAEYTMREEQMLGQHVAVSETTTGERGEGADTIPEGFQRIDWDKKRMGKNLYCRLQPVATVAILNVDFSEKPMIKTSPTEKEACYYYLRTAKVLRCFDEAGNPISDEGDNLVFQFAQGTYNVLAKESSKFKGKRKIVALYRITQRRTLCVIPEKKTLRDDLLLSNQQLIDKYFANVDLPP
jgi:hypothetical protein